MDAVFLGFLPGPLAGDALANLLTGRTNPSAKLPTSYPKFEDGGGIPYLHAVSDKCTKDTGDVFPHWENLPCEVQWAFGHGLSYTTFDFDFVEPVVSEILHIRGQASSDLSIRVNVTNMGDLAGATTVMIFTFDIFRSSTPEYKRLRAFEKVWVEAKAWKIVTLSIPHDDLRFIGSHDDSHYVFENNMQFRLGVGAEVDCRANLDDNRCSEPITIKTDADYVGACEAACDVWMESGCMRLFSLGGDSCLEECSTIHSDLSLELNNDGWG